MKGFFRTPSRAHISVDLLSAYLDKQVTAEERTQVEAHLRACPACSSELESLRATVRLLHALPRVAVPRAFTLSEARAGIRRAEPRTGWWLRGLGAVAAIAIVGVITVSLLQRPAWTPTETVARTAATAAPAQPEAERAAPAPQAQPQVLEAPAEPAVAAETDVVEKAAKALSEPAPTAAPAAAQPMPAPDQTTPPSDQQALAAARPAEEAAPAAAEALPAGSGEPTVAAAEALPAPEGAAMALGRGGGAAVEGAAPAGVLTPEATPGMGSVRAFLPSKVGVAYTDSQALWLIDRSAGARRVAQDEGIHMPQIAPGRDWVVYRVVRQDAVELWGIPWSGRGARLLLSERELPQDDSSGQQTPRRIYDTRWEPGRPVLSVTTVAIPSADAGDVQPRFELWRLDVRTASLEYVLDLGQVPAPPIYSPDGEKFALLQYGTDASPEGRLRLFDLDGQGGQEVYTFPASPAKLSYPSQVAWLPDSSGLWLALPDAAAPGPDQFNGTTLVRVSEGEATTAVAHIDAFQVHWSPDASRLAYTRIIAAGQVELSELYLATADGSDPELYATLTNGEFIRWAPDGRHFLYRDSNEVFVGASGANPRRLGNASSVMDPRWAGADRILYLHDTGSAWLLVLRDLEKEAVGLAPLPRGATYDMVGP